MSSPSQSLRRGARSKTVERIARLGYLARGVVYILIGLIAVQLVLGGSGGRKADQQGAFARLASQPFGTFLLWVLALGLAGYATWRAIEAWAGHLGEHDKTKRTFQRVISAVKAVVYLALAVSAARTAMDSAGSGNAAMSAKVMSHSGGRWLIGFVGVVVIGAGLYMLVQAIRSDYAEDLQTARISLRLREAVLLLGKVGYAARGVVFVLAGYFVVQAAVTFDPDKAQGLDLALRSVAKAPFGAFLLVVVGLGLIAFGAYSCVEARYRRLSTATA